MKPTKQQVKEAIAYMAECPMSLINYDYEKKEFSFVEMIPIPHYDSGNGIDAMDYEEIPSTMPWKGALKTFRSYKNIINNNISIPAPVAPVETDEDYLPF